MGSGPLNETAQWRGEASGRGTWQILSTCLLTLLLCLWTAVHMNVPQEGQADAQFWKKAKWLLIALVYPELVRRPNVPTRWCHGRHCRIASIFMADGVS